MKVNTVQSDLRELFVKEDAGIISIEKLEHLAKRSISIEDIPISIIRNARSSQDFKVVLRKKRNLTSSFDASFISDERAPQMKQFLKSVVLVICCATSSYSIVKCSSFLTVMVLLFCYKVVGGKFYVTPCYM